MTRPLILLKTGCQKPFFAVSEEWTAADFEHCASEWKGSDGCATSPMVINSKNLSPNFHNTCTYFLIVLPTLVGYFEAFSDENNPTFTKEGAYKQSPFLILDPDSTLLWKV